MITVGFSLGLTGRHSRAGFPDLISSVVVTGDPVTAITVNTTVAGDLYLVASTDRITSPSAVIARQATPLGQDVYTYTETVGSGTTALAIDFTGVDATENVYLNFVLDGGELHGLSAVVIDGPHDIEAPSSAFPVLETAANTDFTTDQTSWSINMPSGIVAGDYLLVLAAIDGNPTVSVNTGVSGLNWDTTGGANGSAVRLQWAWKIAEGSDALTLTLGAAEQGRVIARRYSGAAAALYRANANGASGAANPPAVTPAPGSAKYHWIAAVARDGTEVATVAPADFTGLVTRAAGASGASLSVAVRDFEGSTLDPGAFTSADAAPYIVFTFALEPA